MSVEEHLHTLSALHGHLSESLRLLVNANTAHRVMQYDDRTVKLYQKVEANFRKRAHENLVLAHSLYMGGEQ